jgi:peptide/nickel transport system permease protein
MRGLSWFARRIGAAAVTLVLVAAVTFGALAAQPGDAAALLDDPRVPESARTALRAQLALDRPWAERAALMAGRALHGDLGWSVARARPVTDALCDAIGPTALLGGLGLGLGLLAGIGLGTWQATRAGSASDRWMTRLTLTSLALPDVWLALALLTVGARALGWFPTGGWPRGAAWHVQVQHLALPVLTVAILVASRVARVQRDAVARALHEPWVTAALARGVPRRRVLWQHVVRASAAPALSYTGLLVPLVVGGTVFVEVVFAWPGVGRLLLDAVQSRDVPLVLGATLVTAGATVAGGAMADAAQAWLDPRTTL